MHPSSEPRLNGRLPGRALVGYLQGFQCPTTGGFTGCETEPSPELSDPPGRATSRTRIHQKYVRRSAHPRIP
jgi:hypothetical protein